MRHEDIGWASWTGLVGALPVWFWAMHVSRLLTPVDCQYGRLSSAMVLFAGLGACLLLSWVSFSGGRGRLVAMIGTLLPLGLGLSLAWQLVAFIRETGCEA